MTYGPRRSRRACGGNRPLGINRLPTRATQGVMQVSSARLVGPIHRIDATASKAPHRISGPIPLCTGLGKHMSPDRKLGWINSPTIRRRAWGRWNTFHNGEVYTIFGRSGHRAWHWSLTLAARLRGQSREQISYPVTSMRSSSGASGSNRSLNASNAFRSIRRLP